MKPHLSALDHLVLTVSDIDTTIAFYTDTLGMRYETFRSGDGSTRHALTFGRQKLNLHRKGSETEPKSAHPQPGSADLCFLTPTSLDHWHRHLMESGVMIEQGPVDRTGATGPITSIYIRDPDGNLIEIATPIA
jgi:catechol 2,3-dioxygenase-like lactoylglutathione lyase family enzyme